MIKISFDNGQFPDLSLDKPCNGQAILEQLNPEFKKEVIGLKVDNQDFGLNYQFESDAKISFILKNDDSAFMLINYSSALLLAKALVELYPEVVIANISNHEDGFYVDFDYKTQLSTSDLALVSKKLAKLANGASKISISNLSADEALNQASQNPFFSDLLKTNLAKPLIYQINEWSLSGFGQVVDNTKFLTNFKLATITGAYWKNSADNKQLQRISGSAHGSEALLTSFLATIEQRKERDHRLIGKKLGIFTFNDNIGKGLPLFLPNGMIIKRILQRYLQDQQIKYGGLEVSTPVLGTLDLYRKSGHLAHYRENMFVPIVQDGEELVLRPMTCPHHCMIYSASPRTYRDLPLRICEDAWLYRYETSGSLVGLERVRAMQLTDCHIFSTLDQVKAEFKQSFSLIQETLQTLNIKIDYLSLSLRDKDDKAKYYDDDQMWNSAESALREALDELGLEYKEMIGEAAFYGPKLDVQIRTALHHEITLPTIQLDFLLPNRFDLKYIDANNQKQTPVIIHRGLIGTYERFIATLLEQTKGLLPLWLSPVQVDVILINNKPNVEAFASELATGFNAANIRYNILRDDKTNNLIRISEENKVPCKVIIGEQEAESKKVAYRFHGNKETLVTNSISEFIDLIDLRVSLKN